MRLRNTAEQWGGVARFFHWAVALLILAAIALGLIMGDLPPEVRRPAYGLHKSIGLLALALVLCRIVWRLSDGPPAPPPATPHWQMITAELVHWGLYALMVAVPAMGYLSSSYGHYPFPFFLQPDWQIPALTPENRDLSHSLGDLHAGLAWGLIFLLAMHIGAALYHHLIAKDAVLARMTPFIRAPRD